MKRFTSFGGFIESPEKDGMFVLASDCEKAIAEAVMHGQFVQMNAHYWEGDEKYIAEYHGSYIKYARSVMEGKE